MKPTELPPNPDWAYSPPVESRDGRSVWVDAMQLPMAADHQAAADARGNGSNWGRK